MAAPATLGGSFNTLAPHSHAGPPALPLPHALRPAPPHARNHGFFEWASRGPAFSNSRGFLSERDTAWIIKRLRNRTICGKSSRNEGRKFSGGASIDDSGLIFEEESEPLRLRVLKGDPAQNEFVHLDSESDLDPDMDFDFEKFDAMGWNIGKQKGFMNFDEPDPEDDSVPEDKELMDIEYPGINEGDDFVEGEEEKKMREFLEEWHAMEKENRLPFNSVPLGGDVYKMDSRERFPGLEAYPFMDVDSDPEQSSTYSYEPPPDIPIEDLDMIEKVSTLSYAIKDCLPGYLHQPSNGPYSDLVYLNLISKDVNVSDPLHHYMGVDRYQEWNNFQGRNGVFCGLTHLYYEDLVEHRFKRWIYAGWCLTLTKTLTKNLSEWGMTEFWERNFPVFIQDTKARMKACDAQTPEVQNDGRSRDKPRVVRLRKNVREKKHSVTNADADQSYEKTETKGESKGQQNSHSYGVDGNEMDGIQEEEEEEDYFTDEDLLDQLDELEEENCDHENRKNSSLNDLDDEDLVYLTGHSKYEMDQSGQVVSIDSTWNILEGECAAQHYAKAKLYLLILLHREHHEQKNE